MTDDPFKVHPLYNAWINAQTQMFEAQAPFWKQMTENMGTIGNDDLMATTERLWSDVRSQAQEWSGKFLRQSGMGSPGGEGIAQEVLKRMLDPGQFLYAGSDEINQTIQKLVEGPEFADIGTLERQGLKATKEWLALREASAEYRMVTAKAWSKAFERFSKEAMADPDIWKTGPRVVITRWLEIANDELIATQRTDAFLKAQRKLLRAGVDYRLREREMVELWCETHSIPTRTEIDDLHEMVYRLRRELRDLKKIVAAQSAPARKSTARKPRTSTNAEVSND
ncbi:poly(R)-hydroxyalkanoic acid synthase subunit PhaE [Ruegeria atlantica]|uniref:poly(R)-hydroxyalkanoic acid synthase subunit PhaE n=1 Tax=Ruegeria atlantica TaxID=81569 RepID=UPI00147C7D60|nr:poly(R)-hydroxyalkanoic acid synthase subunit PhaE [Ruegeria atlantica]